MDKFGRVAITTNGYEDFYYYVREEELGTFRVNSDCLDARSNAYWDVDILCEDLMDGFEIKYIDDVFSESVDEFLKGFNYQKNGNRYVEMEEE